MEPPREKWFGARMRRSGRPGEQNGGWIKWPVKPECIAYYSLALIIANPMEACLPLIRVQRGSNFLIISNDAFYFALQIIL